MDAKPIYPWGKGTPTWARDATANDNDKAFTVPADKIWELLGINVDYTTDATVGTRNILITITNGTNVLWTGGLAKPTASQKAVLRASQATSTGSSLVPFGDGSDPNQNAHTDLPQKCLLLAGYTVRCYDVSGIAATDDMIFTIHYIEYDA